MPVRKVGTASELDATDLLRGLDSDQRAAVTAPGGVVVVRAGAGSGKTRVLMRRIAWRCTTGSADVDRTLAITFTRQAASEMRARLRDFDLEGNPVIGTIHAVARQMMHDSLSAAGRNIPVVAVNRHAIMSAALGDNVRGVDIDDVLAVHDWCISRREDAETGLVSYRAAGAKRAPAREIFVPAVSKYAELKRRRGVIDVNDMLTWVIETHTSDPRFAESLRFRHRHVLVDEAQDLNPLQWEFVRIVAGTDPDLFLVGDPNQAIYSFNGADRSLFETLPGIEAPVHAFSLPSNYRSTPEIVDFAVAALSRENQVADASSVREPARAVELVRCEDQSREAVRIARLLGQLTLAGGIGQSVAVLARVNALADELRRHLQAQGLPVRDARTGGAWAQAVRTASSLTTREALSTWSSDILDGGEYAEGDPEHGVATEVRRFLDEQRSGAVNGRAFATWFATSGAPSESEGIEVLTFHAAKGREWSTVVVAGAERGLLPHSSARGHAARAEEARLAYVAFTRASDRLVVTWTDERKGKPSGPSPFLPWLDTREPAVDAPVPEIRALAAQARQGNSARDALETWRANRARIARVSPETVLSARHLRAIATLGAPTRDDIARVTGETFANRFADEILAALDEADGAD